MRILAKYYGYLKKEFLLFYKRKKYLYLFLGIPLILGLFFIFALNPSEYMLKAGVCDFDKSELSENALSSLANFKTSWLDLEECPENIRKGIISGRYDIGILIPSGFEDNINNLKQTQIEIYYDNSDIALSNLLSWKIDSSLDSFKKKIIDSLNKELSSKSSQIRSNMDIVIEFTSFSPTIQKRVLNVDTELRNIEEMETDFLVNPIETSRRPVYDSKIDKSSGMVYVFPIVAFFTILMLSSLSIIYDKKTGFLTRVKSNSSGFSYLLFKLVFHIFLVFVQFLIILLLFMINGGRYQFPFLDTIFLILSIGIINTLIGFLIGFYSENEGIAVLFSLIIAFPLMLISGIFFPIITLPKILQYFALITPLNYQIACSKLVLLFGNGFDNLWIYIGVILFAISFWRIKKER